MVESIHYTANSWPLLIFDHAISVAYLVGLEAQQSLLGYTALMIYFRV